MNASHNDANGQPRHPEGAGNIQAGIDSALQAGESNRRLGLWPAHSSRRSFLGGACTALALGHVPTAADAGPIQLRSGLAWASGCFSEPDKFVASYRGRPLDMLNVYMAKQDWGNIASAGGIGNYLAGRSETIMISYPLFPENYNPKKQGVGLWQRAAAGEFDQYHASSATNLARFGRKFVFRIGWEWNNNAMPWACHDIRYAASYIKYFQRIVKILRAKNTSSLIDWSCDKEGRTNADVRRWYPGSSHVDFIGCNSYDFWPALVNESVWNADLNSLRYGGPRGMNAWLNYAKANGKPLSVGEWGLTTGKPHGGGDNPFFIEKMLRFFHDNARYIGYECIFNRNTSSFLHDFSSNPKSGAMYRRLMSPGAL